MYRPCVKDIIDRLMSEEDDYIKKDSGAKQKHNWSPRSGIDRRSGLDRRQVQNLNRPINDETQRRSYTERRKSGELRSDWVRINAWSSMYIGIS